MAAARIQSVDIVKGAALVLIAPTIMAWYLPLSNFWVRSIAVFLFSIEAPLFYMAAGFTMALKAHERNFLFFLQRMLALFLFKSFIDLAIFGILPLVDGSSLVTLGLGCPVIYFFSRWHSKGREPTESYLIGFFIIVALMPLLQNYFGYRQLPTNVDFWDNYPSLREQWLGISKISGIFRNWFIDGWNPFFPFVGFMLLGAFLCTLRDQILEHRTKILIASIPLLMASYVLWPQFAPEPVYRLGQLEVQFPPSVLFTLAFGLASVVTLLVFEFPIIRDRINFFSMLGRSSLFNFILTFALVRFGVYPNFRQLMTVPEFLGITFLITAVLFGTTFLLGHLNQRYVTRETPFLLRMLIGDYRTSFFMKNKRDENKSH